MIEKDIAGRTANGKQPSTNNTAIKLNYLPW